MFQGEGVNSGLIVLAQTRYVQDFDRVWSDEIFQLANLMEKRIVSSLTVMNVQDRFIGVPGVSYSLGAATGGFIIQAE